MKNSDKINLLLRRGFNLDEIEDISNISDEEWHIESITPKEVMDRDYDYVKKKLFEKDSVNNSSIMGVGGNKTFEDFTKAPSERMSVPAGILDPYIAAFTRAVNECGAYTVMSCDGWHKDPSKASGRVLGDYRLMRLWMEEPYSTLWLWMITEYVFGENWKTCENRDFLSDYLRWHDMWEPNGKDDDGVGIPCSCLIYRMKNGDEKKAYDKIYKYARFMKMHKEELLRIRSKWIEATANYDKPIESMGFLEVRRNALAIIENDLRMLRNQYFHNMESGQVQPE